MNEDKIKVKAVYSNIINFAMQQNYVLIIRNLTIENLTDLPLEKVTIKISSEPSFLHRWERTIDVIPAKEIIDVGVINLILSPEYLLQLTERISGVLSVEISSNNEIIKNINEDIDILAYDEWSGTAIMPELITAFVTPNHPCVTQIIIKASEVLKKWTGSPSFTAYQSNNTNTIAS